MKVHDIIWLEEIADKLAWKHGVLTAEVEEALRGRCKVFKKEQGRVEGEHLYLALGRTKNGRYLAVYFILKDGDNALVVTARNMTAAERRRYEKK